MNLPASTFRILSLGPFNAKSDSDSNILWLNPEDLPQAPSKVGATVAVRVSKEITPDEYLDLRFQRITDFRPERILRANPLLKNVLEARDYVLEAKKKKIGYSEILERLRSWPGLPPIKFEIPQQDKRATESSSGIDEILKMVALPGEHSGPDKAGDTTSGQLEAFLSKALREIFADTTFKAMEAGWQGLDLLAKYGSEAEIELGILPISAEGLYDLIDSLVGRLVTDLPNLVVVDYPFDASSRSMNLLERLGNLAETLMVPVLVWIGPGFFHLGDWSEIESIGFIPHYLDRAVYGKWNSLKNKPVSQWMVVTCNRFLARFPYGTSYPSREVMFQEPTPPWVSPVWGLAALICTSLARTGWPALFTGSSQASLEDLGLLGSGPDDVLCTEFSPTSERVEQLVSAGLVPLCPVRKRDQAFFPFERTLGGGSLAYQLVLSRVVQILLWCKEHLPGDLEGTLLEQEVSRIISKYWEKTARIPLEMLQVSAFGTEGKRGGQLSVTLRPSRKVLPSNEEIRLDMAW